MRPAFVTLSVLALLAGRPDAAENDTEVKRQAAEDLTIAVTAPRDPKDHHLQVAFHNSGREDLLLNLGIMLANGKKQFATAIQLEVTDSKGVMRQFRPQGPNIAGRVDDLIVPLCAGASYALRLNLDRCWSDDPQDPKVGIPRGDCRVAALFEGRAAAHISADSQAGRLMELWAGRAKSKEVKVTME